MAEVTPEVLIERARKLAPTLRERAEKAGELRRTPDETIADFHELGFFKAVQPKRYGGYEMNPKILYQLQIELGKGCASSAWVFGVLSVHTWQLALFPKETQDEVWGEDPKTLISSSYMPVGKSKWLEDGAVSLSGHWSFSSGCDHAQWIFLGGFVPTEEGSPPDMRTFLLPRADYEIKDNWFVSGLKSSGSKDILVDGATVPAHRMHKFFDGFRSSSPGNEVNTSPVYRYPFGQIHVRSVSTPALGAALGALESFNEYMKTKVSQATGGKASDNLLNNIAAAEAAAIIDREIITLERNFDEMFGYLERGEAIPLERRARFRNDSARAVSAAVEVVDALFTACGGRVLFQGNDINRHWQDVHAIRAHHANGPDKPAANFGAMQFGNKNSDFFI
ncbi:MAG: acyl-CoA dehydrogenase family protein [Sandaracinaceae bacterium]|nr:acyl-CoA dehydrogenase family protein [Sandaracinaceae bacterium]